MGRVGFARSLFLGSLFPKLGFSFPVDPSPLLRYIAAATGRSNSTTLEIHEEHLFPLSETVQATMEA
jgi:hypothetical protein